MNDNWTPPQELTRSRPRAVALAPAGIALIVLALALGAGGIAGAVALGRLGDRQAAEQRLLSEQGVEADGVVTRQWRGKGKDNPRWVEYRFTSNGNLYENRSRASAAQWKRSTVGSHLPVLYVPSNPALNYPSGWERKTLPLWVPDLLGTIVLLCSGFAMLPIRAQYRLLSEGRPAPGIVTRYRQSQHGKVYYYEFPVVSGANAQGRAGPSHRPPAIGSTLCILYSPDHPTRNAPYPLPLVRTDRES